jgi:hypothetical protein
MDHPFVERANYPLLGDKTNRQRMVHGSMGYNAPGLEQVLLLLLGVSMTLIGGAGLLGFI